MVVDSNLLMDIADNQFVHLGLQGLPLFVKLMRPHFLLVPYDVQMELDGLKALPTSSKKGYLARQAWKQCVVISKDRSHVLMELVSQRPNYTHEKQVDDIIVRRALLIADFYSKVCVVSADNRVQSQAENAGLPAFSYLNCGKSIRQLATEVEQFLTSVTE